MKKAIVSLALLAGFVSQVWADEPAAPAKFYRLNFVMQEVDGTKVVNSREYSATQSANTPKCSIRANSRVSIAIPSTGGNYQVYNVGVNIDAFNLHEVSGGLSLTVNATIDSLSQEAASSSNVAVNPTVRTNAWESTLLIPLKKPTVIFSSDDLTSKHKMQLVLTATPVL